MVRYLSQWIRTIWKDNSSGNKSVHNISFQNMLIHQTLINQKIIPDFSMGHSYDNLSTLASAGLANENVEDYEKYFDEEIIAEIELSVSNGFINETDKAAIKEELKETINEFQKSFDSSNDSNLTYRIESSISIVDGKTQIQGHNENSRVDLNNPLNSLKERLFVSEDDSFLFLNKTFYTREQEDWNSIELALRKEKEIIIVDPYFFLSDVNGGKFGNRELRFLNAICKSEDEKDFVIICQNCVCAEWLEEFSRRFKEGYNETELAISSHKKCHLTFIGVKSKKSLHDRFIISNYRLIFSGHSFPLYFDDNGKFSANGSIGLSVGSVADENNEHVMVKTLEYLQRHLLDEGHCYVYGDGKSHLLDLSKNTKWHPNKGVLESYPYGEKIKIEWDMDTLHWKRFTKFQNNNKQIQVQGRNARIVNIKRNIDSTPYVWFSYAYVLNDNNKDSQ